MKAPTRQSCVREPLEAGACILLLALLFLSSCDAGSARVEDFPWRVPLTGESYGKPVRVALPREVVSEAGPLFSGMRVFDDRGREVPFMVETPSMPEARERIRWEVQGSENGAEGRTFLLLRSAPQGPVSNLEIKTSQQWACSDVDVLGSMDGSSWQHIASGRVADLRPYYNASALSIGLPPAKSTHLKVVFRKIKEGGIPYDCLLQKEKAFADLPPLQQLVEVKEFTSSAGTMGSRLPVLDELVITGPANRQSREGDTMIHLGRVGLPLVQVSLGVEGSCFYREAGILCAEINEDALYESKLSGSVYAIPPLGQYRDTLGGDMGRASYVRIRVKNHLSRPVRISRVALRWVRPYLAFAPEKGRSYGIFMGGSGSAPSRSAAFSGMGTEWKAGAMVMNERYDPVFSLSKQLRLFFFVGAAILVVYCLGFIVLRVRNT